MSQVSGSNIHTHKKCTAQKMKFFLEELNIKQDVFQDVKNNVLICRSSLRCSNNQNLNY